MELSQYPVPSPRPATDRTAVPYSAVQGVTENVERLHRRLRVGGSKMSTRQKRSVNRKSFIVATPVASLHPINEKRPILADKSPETLLSTFIYEEKEYECHCKNNQNDAAVRRLINAGTLGVQLLLTLCCAVNRQRINGCGVCLDRLIYRRFVGDRCVSGAEVQPGRLRRSNRRR